MAAPVGRGGSRQTAARIDNDGRSVSAVGRRGFGLGHTVRVFDRENGMQKGIKRFYGMSLSEFKW